MRTGPIFVRDIYDNARRQIAYARERGRLATKDTLLDTDTILHAEPGPTISNRGSRWTGGGTPETDAIAKGIAMSIATLKDADQARVWATLEKYAAKGWKLNGDGSATTDIAMSGPQQMRASRDATGNLARQMNESAREYWAGNR